MNGYYCTNDDLGILLFQSEDPDNLDRSMQPIYLNKEGTGMRNKLNAMMEHGWDGFYVTQKRMSRFPGIVEAPRGSSYNITFTGSPAKKMRFVLRSINQKSGMVIRIAYPSAISR